MLRISVVAALMLSLVAAPSAFAEEEMVDHGYKWARAGQTIQLACSQQVQDYAKPGDPANGERYTAKFVSSEVMSGGEIVASCVAGDRSFKMSKTGAYTVLTHVTEERKTATCDQNYPETGTCRPGSSDFSEAQYTDDPGYPKNRTDSRTWLIGYCWGGAVKVTAYDNGKPVSTNWADAGLDLPWLKPGDRITADQHDIEVKIGNDESQTIRLKKGGRVAIDTCEGSDAGTSKADREFKFRLQLGRIWVQVAKIFGGDGSSRIEVQTDRAVAGVRGTTFEVAWDEGRQRTDLKVIEGKVAFRNRRGKRKEILVTGGHRARQERNGKPRQIA